MILDFETDELGESWNADVCVVGAGAAGLALAHELLRSGRRVMLLEGGGRSRWERTSQALNKTELRGHRYAGAHSGRFRTLGGSTSAWSGQVMELDDLDFEPRPWVPGSGWPIPKAELREAYRRAEALERTDALPPNREVWRAHGGKPDLGEDFSITLSRYCPEKKFVRVFSDLFDDPRCLLVLHANAVELLASDNGRRIVGLRIRTLRGKETIVPVHRLALCLGGIETSRFLLNQRFCPWNASGLVGRHFQDHIQCFAGEVRKADLHAPNWPFGPWRVGGSHLTKVRLAPAAQRRLRTLNVSGMIELEDGVYPAMRTGIKLLLGPASTITLGELARMAPFAPGAIWHHLRSKADPKFTLPWAQPRLSVFCEQSPLSESRIELSQARDALGLRRARLSWTISDLELHTIRTYAKLAIEAFAAHGVEIVPHRDLMSDRFADRCGDMFHHCGGTRMSSDPNEGVVDTDLRLHGLDNAYVCSSSVFPTSGFANPTHTIIALAARLAERLGKQAALQRAA